MRRTEGARGQYATALMRHSREHLAVLLTGSVFRVEAAISPRMQDTHPTIDFLVHDATFFERHV